MTTSNKLEIRAIALDELGIYFAGENQIDVDDMAQPDMTPSGTVQYIRSGDASWWELFSRSNEYC